MCARTCIGRPSLRLIVGPDTEGRHHRVVCLHPGTRSGKLRVPILLLVVHYHPPTLVPKTKDGGSGNQESTPFRPSMYCTTGTLNRGETGP